MEEKRLNKEQNARAFRWTLTTLKGQWGLLLVVSLIACVSALLGVLLTLVLRDVIDAATGLDLNGIWRNLLLLSVMVVLQYVGSYASGRLQNLMQVRMSVALRQRILCALLQKRYASVSGFHSGEMMNRLTTDADTVVTSSVSFLPRILGMFVRIVGAGVVLSILSWQLVLMALAAGLLVGGCMLLFRRVLKRLQRNVRETEGRARSFMQEILQELPVVKAFSATEAFSDRLLLRQKENAKSRIRHNRFTTFAGTLIGFSFMAAYVLALGWGAVAIYHGIFTYGTLTAVLNLVSQVRSPLVGAADLIPSYYSMLVSAERLMEFEGLPDEAGAALPPAAGEFCRLVAEDVSFHYEGGEPVLRDVSLTIERGDMIVLAGRSGIGKSTLVKLTLALYEPDEGRLFVEDAAGERHAVSAATRPYFAYVPQGNCLFAGTIRENVSLFDSAPDEERLWSALKGACAEDFVRALPQGLDTPLGEGGAGISEGQAQRIAVARAWMSPAPVLLLDEATASLDEATEQQLLTNIRAAGRTCIMISHRPGVYRVATRRFRINGGYLTEELDAEATETEES